MTKLDRCWKDCLRMWKWISENWKPGNNVDYMKTEWLQVHRFSRKSLSANAKCFFCEYQASHGAGRLEVAGNYYCKHCPGVYVSKTFDCYAYRYHFEYEPKAFYAKLLKLDAIRKK